MAKAPTASKASIKSILPDSLDVIEEASERSEDGGCDRSPRRVLADQRVRKAAELDHSLGSGLIIPTMALEYNNEKEGGYQSTLTEETSSDSSHGEEAVVQGEKQVHMHTMVKRVSPLLPIEPDENGLFNFDDDLNSSQEPTMEEEQLTWRLDPSKSLSDWTIKVCNKETRQPELYHVHKNILAVGPRRSEYFVRTFRNNNRMSHVDVNSTTEVWLTSVACRVIPQLLDYMYSNEGRLDINTESATGLRHLAQFFGIRVLHKKVMDFMLRDLSMKNVQIYYQDSVALADDKIAELAAEHCAQNIMIIDVTNPLLSSIDPVFFRRIMSAPEINSQEKHYHVSLLLAQYCTLCKHLLDDQDFVRLTDARFLPLVDRSAALTLMEMEADLCGDSLDNNQTSSLQQRCIKDLTDHWTDFSDMDQTQILRVCRKLSSNVVTELLIKSLGQAKQKMTQQSITQAADLLGGVKEGSKSLGLAGSGSKSVNGGAGSDKQKKAFEARLAKLKQSHAEALEAKQKEYEATLQQMQNQLAEREVQMQKVWKELMCFERMPNQPDGKVVPSSVTSVASVMPDAGNHSPEGFLLVNKKEGSKFPIFFYKKETLTS